MEYDSRLKHIYDTLDSFSASRLQKFSQESTEVYSTLGHDLEALHAYTDNPNCWSDSVKNQFDVSLASSKELRNSLEAEAATFESIGGAAGSLVATVIDYLQAVDKVTAVEGDYSYYVVNADENKPSKPSKPKETDDEDANKKAYINYQNSLNNYNNWFIKQEDIEIEYNNAYKKVQELYETSYGLVNELEGLLGGSSAFAADGLSTAGLTPKHRTEIDKDGNTIDITEWYDENNVKKMEELVFVDQDGQQVNKITRTFYDNGNRKTEDSDYAEKDGHKYKGVHSELDEDGNVRVWSVEEHEWPSGTRYIKQRIEYHDDGTTVETTEEEFNADGTYNYKKRKEYAKEGTSVTTIEKQKSSDGITSTNVRIERDKENKIKAWSAEERVYSNGCHNYNYNKEYAEDGSSVTTIEKQEDSSGTTSTNVCVERDEENKMKVWSAEERVYSNGCHNYNERTEYAKDGTSVKAIEKQEDSKGNINTNVYAEYDENDKTQVWSAEEQITPDGTRIIGKSIEYNEEGNVESSTAEEVVLTDGTTVEYEEYKKTVAVTNANGNDSTTAELAKEGDQTTANAALGNDQQANLEEKLAEEDNKTAFSALGGINPTTKYNSFVGKRLEEKLSATLKEKSASDDSEKVTSMQQNDGVIIDKNDSATNVESAKDEQKDLRKTNNEKRFSNTSLTNKTQSSNNTETTSTATKTPEVNQTEKYKTIEGTTYSNGKFTSTVVEDASGKKYIRTEELGKLPRYTEITEDDFATIQQAQQQRTQQATIPTGDGTFLSNGKSNVVESDGYKRRYDGTTEQVDDSGNTRKIDNYTIFDNNGRNAGSEKIITDTNKDGHTWEVVTDTYDQYGEKIRTGGQYYGKGGAMSDNIMT